MTPLEQIKKKKKKERQHLLSRPAGSGWIHGEARCVKVSKKPVKALKTPCSTYSNFSLLWITDFRSDILLHVLQTCFLYVSMTPLYLACGKILVECYKKKRGFDSIHTVSVVKLSTSKAQ